MIRPPSTGTSLMTIEMAHYPKMFELVRNSKLYVVLIWNLLSLDFLVVKKKRAGISKIFLS